MVGPPLICTLTPFPALKKSAKLETQSFGWLRSVSLPVAQFMGMKDTVDKVNPSVVTGRAAVEGKFVVTSLPTTIPIDVLLRLAGVVVLQRKPLYVKLIPFLSVDTPPGITNPVLERAADSWNSVRTRSAGVLRASPE